MDVQKAGKLGKFEALMKDAWTVLRLVAWMGDERADSKVVNMASSMVLRMVALKVGKRVVR